MVIHTTPKAPIVGSYAISIEMVYHHRSQHEASMYTVYSIVGTYGNKYMCIWVSNS